MSDYGYAPTKLYTYQELNLIENMGHEILFNFFQPFKNGKEAIQKQVGGQIWPSFANPWTNNTHNSFNTPSDT